MKKKMALLVLGTALVLSACGASSSQEKTEDKTSEAVSEMAEGMSEAESENGKTTEETAEESAEDIKAPEEDTQTSAEEQTGTEAEANAQDIIEVPADTAVEYEGKALEVSLDAGEYGDGPAVLTYGDDSLELTDYSLTIPTSYLIPGEEGAFRLITGYGQEDDYCQTCIVSYKPGEGFAQGDYVDGSVAKDSQVTAVEVIISSSCDCFGTYGYTCEYTIDGLNLTPAENYYDFHNEPDDEWAEEVKNSDGDEYFTKIFGEDGRKILVLLADFNAEAEDGSAVTVKSGDAIYPEGCDMTTNTFYFTYNDQLCHVTWTKSADGYGFDIDGVNENDIFAQLPYAG